MDIAKCIDHTALKPDVTMDQISQLCHEAHQYGFVSVCVNSVWVDSCAVLLKNTDVKICAVVGFPFGASMGMAKAKEAMLAVEMGAQEIDMVVNIGGLKSNLADLVAEDILVVRSATPGVILKVIIETCLLTREEKILACKIAKRAGADFVKTSTGFSSGGATVEDVTLMRKVVGKKIGVKAAGGIRDFATAKAMLDAGANRLGCSASVAIVKEALSKT